MDDEDFTIPYITDTIPSSPDSHQLPSQAKRNVLIVTINGEEPITSQGVLDELNRYQTPREKTQDQYQFMQKEELPKNIS